MYISRYYASTALQLYTLYILHFSSGRTVGSCVDLGGASSMATVCGGVVTGVCGGGARAGRQQRGHSGQNWVDGWQWRAMRSERALCGRRASSQGVLNICP